MKLERLAFDISENFRKKKLLKSSRFNRILNRIGPRKYFLNCFGCGDSLWWKEDVSMAFRKPEQEVETYEDGFSPQQYQNFYEVPNEDANLIVYRHGVIICNECLTKKSEAELIEIFEKVKKKWLKNKTHAEEIDRINNYRLFLPIRTTKGMFKKELSSTNPGNQSFPGFRLLKKMFSLMPSYFTSNNS